MWAAVCLCHQPSTSYVIMAYALQSASEHRSHYHFHSVASCCHALLAYQIRSIVFCFAESFDAFLGTVIGSVAADFVVCNDVLIVDLLTKQVRSDRRQGVTSITDALNTLCSPLAI